MARDDIAWLLPLTPRHPEGHRKATPANLNSSGWPLTPRHLKLGGHPEEGGLGLVAELAEQLSLLDLRQFNCGDETIQLQMLLLQILLFASARRGC